MESSLFMEKTFWWKILNTFKIFFSDVNLFIIALIPGIIDFLLVTLLGSIWLASFFTIMWTGWLNTSIFWTGIFLSIVLAIIIIVAFIIAFFIVNMLGAIIAIIYISEKEKWNKLMISNLLKLWWEQIWHYFNVIIASLIYLLRPIMIIILWIIISLMSIYLWPIGVLWIVVILFGIIDCIIKSLDILIVYNIAIIENKNWEESIEKSKKLMDWKKWISFLNIFVLNIILGIIGGIILSIFTEWTWVYKFIDFILKAIYSIMSAIMLYMIYRQYKEEFTSQNK